MARINLQGLVARSPRTGLSQVRSDGFALAAPGRAVADVGRALQDIGDQIGARQAKQDDLEVQRALSTFDYESGYIKEREAALRDGTIDGFHARTAASYDAAVVKHLESIDNGRVRSAVERRLLSLRTGFLANAAKAEEGVLTREADTARSVKIAESVATFDYASRYLELSSGADVNDPNFATRINEDYRARVDDYVSSITDPQTRETVRLQLLGRASTYTNAAAGAAKKNALDTADAATNRALDTTLNIIRSDPNAYGTSLEDGFRIIDGLNRPENEKEELRTAFRHNAARTYFEAGLDAAASAEDFDRIEAEANSEAWAAQLAPKDKDAVLDQIRVGRAGGQRALAAQVRTSMESVRERLDVGLPVSAEDVRNMELGARATGDAGLQMDVAKLAARNRVLTTYGDKPLPVIREEIRRRREAEASGAKGSGKSLPPELRESVYGAGANHFGVSKEFLAGLAHFEFSGQFRPGAGETDYKKKELGGNTTAMGPYQFTERTWLEIVDGNPSLFPEVTGAMTRDAVLDLRGDVTVATRAAALYAKRNGAILGRMLGREPTDAELVAAHFLGAGGAHTLIGQMAVDPKQIGSAVLPDAAKNNPGIFKFPNGADRNLAQVMDRIVERSIGGAGRDPLAAVELKAFEDLAARQEKLTKNNMMGLAEATSAADESMATAEGGFSADNMQRRGDKARYVAEVNSIPQAEWTPLMPDEVQYIKRFLDNPDTTVDDQLAMAGTINEMGPKMAMAAFRQVGLEDPVFAHAASLMAQTERTDVARQILSGRRKLADRTNPLGAGTTATDTKDAFSVYTAEALAGITNTDAIYKAALAHYAEVRDPTATFNRDDFEKSVAAVLGAKIEDVNGSDVLLPNEVDAGTVEDFLDVATMEDLITMSMSGDGPQIEEGFAIEDVMSDATLQAVGGGYYRVIIDGRVLVTRQDAATPYILKLDPALIARAVAERG